MKGPDLSLSPFHPTITGLYENTPACGGIIGRGSSVCHLTLYLNGAFTLLSVINGAGAVLKGLSPASFHVWTGSLVRMITSLKAWSRSRLWENDYGLNLWLGLWTFHLLQWHNFFSFKCFYLLSFSPFGQEIVYFVRHGCCNLSSLYDHRWGSHLGRRSLNIT